MGATAASARHDGVEVTCHRHDHHRLVLALAGRMEMEVAGPDGVVDAHHGALIPRRARGRAATPGIKRESLEQTLPDAVVLAFGTHQASNHDRENGP